MEQPNFFDYSDIDSMCEISRVIRNNDKTKLRKILIERKRKKIARQPLPVDNRGWTALHVAASRNECGECLKLMLRYGECVCVRFDVNARSFEGKTALFIACEQGCDENVLSLLKKGADANAKSPDGTSPLHVASIEGHDAIARHLLRYGAAVDEQDWQGFTSLHLAALYDRLDVCETLLEKNADTRTSDSDGNLALHLACQNGSWRTVQLLLEKSASTDDQIDRQNEDGVTPLMLAARNGPSDQCVRYLLQRGASTEATSNDGFVALQYAAVAGNVHILRTLLEHTEYADMDETYSRTARHVLLNEQSQSTLYPILCCALASGSIDCCNSLLESKLLPKKILQTPYVENSGRCIDVFSPLAYLLSVRADTMDETLDQLVRLLLRHDIVYTNTFVDQLQLNVEWSSLLHRGRDRFNLINPYDIIFNSQWPTSEKFAYARLLNQFDVTVDYCLQCYNNNNNNNAQTRWRDFDVRDGYDIFYQAVLEAVDASQIDVLGLYLSHSRILEPDRLCRYLVSTKSSELDDDDDVVVSNANANATRRVYDYLISLKPSYYKYDRYARTRSDIFHFDSQLTKVREFSRCNLQQLCRTKIRHQLRGVTLIDNLRTFHRRILDLPLPSYLKDYLLFRN